LSFLTKIKQHHNINGIIVSFKRAIVCSNRNNAAHEMHQHKQKMLERIRVYLSQTKTFSS